ncbi:protein PYRICULARIA ORYZAE RESISTANCE 21-like [Populus alba x Populus x berolinensis]|nr:protein PYRICULARIA ORYZAE RESISTANCE 21-like [Populus alba x Populus x berolinensis]
MFLHPAHNSIISSGPDQSFDKTMAEKKVTTMVIKFDLECEKCHKKIKKVLCRIPQIQNQIYDKKAGTVTITVVCCSPEKIKEKIIYKGGEAVKSIEIKVPEKPKPAPEKKQPDKPPKTVDGDGKPKALIVEPSKPNEPEKLKVVNVEPVHPRTCCAECYRGISGGPCYHDYGRPAPPCYEAYGRPVYDSWFGGGGGGYGCQRSGYYACRGEYVCEDNPSSCTIM